jgi:hypothetical protein
MVECQSFLVPPSLLSPSPSPLSLLSLPPLPTPHPSLFLPLPPFSLTFSNPAHTGTIQSSTGSGIYINASAAEAGLSMSATNFTNDSPFKYCCGSSHVPLTSPSNMLCGMLHSLSFPFHSIPFPIPVCYLLFSLIFLNKFNFLLLLADYPACSEACGGTTGSCACLGQLTKPCTCQPPFTGSFCNIYGIHSSLSFALSPLFHLSFTLFPLISFLLDNCTVPNFCNAGEHFCGHDTQYDFICCATNNTCNSMLILYNKYKKTKKQIIKKKKNTKSNFIYFYLFLFILFSYLCRASR